MSVQLTEQEFSKHVNTKFRVTAEEPIELQLMEVKGYVNKENEHPGMERFSLYFIGPESYLPQSIYSIEHEQMGVFDLFLVPVGKHENGFRYEAVFNYFNAMAVD